MGLIDSRAYNYGARIGAVWDAGSLAGDRSYDRSEGTEYCDVAIIGAGLTGLSAALHLAVVHGAQVIVIDAAYPGWGASGRSLGVCAAAPMGLYRRAQTIGAAVFQQLAQADREAQTILDELVEPGLLPPLATRIMLETIPSDPGAGDALQQLALAIRQADGPRLDILPQGQQPSWRARGDRGSTPTLVDPAAAALDPLALTRIMAQAAQAAGVRIFANARTRSIERTRRQTALHFRGGSLRTFQILVATNGQSRGHRIEALRNCLMPDPFLSLATRAVPRDQWAGLGLRDSFAMRVDDPVLGAITARFLPDGRLLASTRVGGIDDSATTKAMARRLLAALRQYFPWAPAGPPQTVWTGLGARTVSGLPFIGPLDRAGGLSYAGGLDVDSIPLALWLGRTAALQIAYPSRAEGLAFMSDRPPGRHYFRRFRFMRRRRAIDRHLLRLARDD